MTEQSWPKVKEIVERALECAPDQRAELVREACEGDRALIERVEALLAAYDVEGDSLDELVDGVAEAGRRWAAMTGSLGRPFPTNPNRGSSRQDAGEGLPEDPLALVGTTFDGLYDVDALLGRGGMGTVYRARHTLLHDVVALKLLPRELGRNPKTLRRFLREGQAARRFRHPNAVTVYDLRTGQDGTAYLVLEYVDGLNLREELQRRGPLSPDELIPLLEPIASVLDAAHASGVVHRDLKPENVMLARSEAGQAVVKVLDLGIAKLVEESDSGTGPLTQPGAAVGTPRYMAPEQWGELPEDGRPEVDGRCDVYTMGVMVYELVSGSVPFLGRTAPVLMRQHLTETPRPLHGRVLGVSASFDEAVARAMSKDRGKRQASAGQFVRELRASLGASTPDVPPAERSSTGPQPGASTDPGVHTTWTGETVVSMADAGAWTHADEPTNLPPPATSFVGRKREMADVRALLREHRFVTLTGPGGIGKTRLALEVARDEIDLCPDGVWLVELASLADGALVPAALAAALGVRQVPSQPLVDALGDHIGSKRALLVVDNCEHLVEACAALAAMLLRTCPRLKLLATSREPLGVDGEAAWPVPPLALHAAAEAPAAECEAVQLFVDRARMARPRFVLDGRNAAAVTRLCEQLEGIPLAIELAAGRTAILSVAQIAARLGQRLDLLVSRQADVPERHRTLRAALDWSYELLSPELQRLFADLSVFAGGWTLEAAEAVCGPGEGTQGVAAIEALDQLRECSLLLVEERGEEMRFRMLETVREYGIQALTASGSADEVRGRHARYFLALAEETAPQFMVSEVLERVEAEHDNLRAALAWLFEHDDEGCLRLAVALRHSWPTRGHVSEARRWLEAALERGASAPAPLRAEALQGVGFIACRQGDHAAACAHLEEGRRIGNEMGDAMVVGFASLGLGVLALARDDVRAARAFAEESVAIGKDLKHDLLTANALNVLGEAVRQGGDWAAARPHYEGALAIYRRLGHRSNASIALVNLGEIAYEAGELDAATASFREALEIDLELGNDAGVAYSLDGLAAVAAKLGAHARAARLAGAVEALREGRNLSLEPVDRAFRERYVDGVRERLGEAAFAAALAEGRALTLEQAALLALEEEP